MNKFSIPVGVISLSVIVFAACHSKKKAMTEPTANEATNPSAVSYAVSVKSIVASNCSPCHIPAQGGTKKALDNYDALKTNIDDVIRRIDLNPTDTGFMPFKHPKLSDSTIAVFKQWRDAGMPQ
jgi:Cytochrome C oxidase, cbb3-type, subunit III